MGISIEDIINGTVNKKRGLNKDSELSKNEKYYIDMILKEKDKLPSHKDYPKGHNPDDWCDGGW